MLMQETFPEDEFLRILFKFKKRKENFVVVCPRPPENVTLGGFTEMY